ncbi:MAG TPA: hypothetical protein EYN68_00815, partial [Candidatus Marinimicrobia bacterium]|nr:hypothetical protein [Candidatus Neomarinimicrobiota bacterium]
MNIPRLFLCLIVLAMTWGCGGSQTLQSRPSPPKPIATTAQVPTAGGSAQERLEFFPTANRARKNIGTLITLSESRVDATITALSDELITTSENNEMTSLQSQEETTFKDLIFDLDAFIGYLPTDSKSYATTTKGRNNLEAKYASYSLSVSGSAIDQVIDEIEKSAIESIARVLVEELRTIESALPLPPDSLETGSTFIFESDSVDLFFEVVKSVEEMTKEMEELRQTVADYGTAKQEMVSFLDREKKLTTDLEESKSRI